jgi:hypothetical protein
MHVRVMRHGRTPGVEVTPCALSTIAGPEPRRFAGAKPAAIGERQHNPKFEALGASDGRQPPGLLRTQGERQVKRLLDVIDLSRQIAPPP